MEKERLEKLKQKLEKEKGSAKTTYDAVNKADLQELGGDKEVEEYLLQKNLIKKRPGAVALKGRGVTYRDLKKANFEQKVHKKAEEKVERVRAECSFKINKQGQFTSVITTVINNFLGRLQTTTCSLISQGSTHLMDALLLTAQTVRTLHMFLMNHIQMMMTQVLVRRVLVRRVLVLEMIVHMMILEKMMSLMMTQKVRKIECLHSCLVTIGM